MTTTETQRMRLQMLIGTDDTKGVRGDLARMRTSAARGFATAPNGKPIGEAIAALEIALTTYQASLAALSCPYGCEAFADTDSRCDDCNAKLMGEPPIITLPDGTQAQSMERPGARNEI